MNNEKLKSSQERRVTSPKAKLKGLSLFSGIGGIEIGLEEWVETKAYCEIDKYAQAVLRNRFSNPTIHSDITKLKGKEGEFDIIFGGFPCQDISNAGKRKGIHAERSGLWFEMLRIISEVRPRYVFVENVSAIINRGLDVVLGTLSEIGYDAVWTTLRASDVGAPHRRERFFMLAYSNVSDSEGSLLKGCPNRQGQEQSGGSNSFSRTFWEIDPADLPDPILERCGRGQTQSRTDKIGSLETNEQDNGNDTTDLNIEVKPRLGGVVNGFPPKLDTCGYGYTPRVTSEKAWRTQRLKCLGNAVVPLQAKEAFIRLIKIKEEL